MNPLSDIDKFHRMHRNYEDDNIITSSNAGKKKLSFKGWEKCLEAFSQGKGTLSHHCSRLINQLEETGCDEEAISWSSSDSEYEEHSLLGRQRPNRTLSSCINFDNCVSARKGRRRQTYARFSRSIEKRLGDDSTFLSDSSQNGGSCHVTQDCIEKNVLEVSSCKNISFAPSQHGWQDVSVMNQRISLFSESDLSLDVDAHDSPRIPDHTLGAHHSSELLDKARSCESTFIYTPQKNLEKAPEASSPVFETRKIVRSSSKANAKSPVIRSSPEKHESKKDESEFPFELPVSPPLKLRTQVKKRKSLQLSRLNSTSTEDNEGSISVSESTLENRHESLLLLQVPNQNQNSELDGWEGTASKSPLKTSLDSILESPSLSPNALFENKITSPIIGKAFRAITRKRIQSMRSRAPKSPVLGSPAPVKRRKKVKTADFSNDEPDKQLSSGCCERDENDVSPSLLQIPRWNLEVFRKGAEGKVVQNSVASQFKGSVKRSLYFTDKCNVRECARVGNIDVGLSRDEDERRQLNLAPSEARGTSNLRIVSENVHVPPSPPTDLSEPSFQDAGQTIYSKESDLHHICHDKDAECKEDVSAACESSHRTHRTSSSCGNNAEFQDESYLIEDINTEQLTTENVFLKPCLSSTVRRKGRKTLSLGNKAAFKVSCSGDVQEVQNSNQTCMIEDDSQTQHVEVYKPLLKDQEKRVKLHLNGLKGIPLNTEGESSGCLSPADHANLTHCNDVECVEPSSSLCMRNDGLTLKAEGNVKIEFRKDDLGVNQLKYYKSSSLGIVMSQMNAGPDDERQVESPTSTEGDADSAHIDIESILSPSPEKIPLDPEIEVDRCTPSFTPSPVTISQSSSPTPAVNTVSPQHDEHNAPPKKGRKKLKHDGLAARMQRLLNRHRSSVRVWQYKRSKIRSVSDSSGRSGKDSGTLLSVDNAWTEYSHVVLQCRPSEEDSEMKTSGSGNTLSGCILVILDTYIVEKFGHVMTAPMIRIFPPWQALRLKGVNVIISASFIEVVSCPSTPPIETCTSAPVKEVLQEFSCSCLSGSYQGQCSVHPELWIDGALGSGRCKLVNLLFPEGNHDASRLLSCVNDGADGSEHNNFTAKSTVLRDTVAELVTNYSSAQTMSGWLSITVLRIFQYKQDGRNNKKIEHVKPSCTWSVLGQDGAGELCEVVFGSANSCSESLLPDLETGDCIGRSYRLSGFIPVQRINPFRTSGLWSVVLNMPSFGSCEQRVLYIFAPAFDRWQYTLSAVSTNQSRDLWQPKIISLQNILSEENAHGEQWRASTVCRLLHMSSEHLYVTDTQLCPGIIVISLKSTVYVAPKVTGSPLVLLVDLEISSGMEKLCDDPVVAQRQQPRFFEAPDGDSVGQAFLDLNYSTESYNPYNFYHRGGIKADKYSRVMAIDSKFVMRYCTLSEEYCHHLASINPLLPTLKVTTPAHSLAMLTGFITGVDEASAFMWPACSSCGNELLSVTDTQNESYHCDNCKCYCKDLTLRMSLQVIVACSNVPPQCRVRIQLLQKTIEKLLPSAPSSEGYEMDAVLGQQIGPLRCEVLSVVGGNFTLQELPLL